MLISEGFKAVSNSILRLSLRSVLNHGQPLVISLDNYSQSFTPGFDLSSLHALE